MQPDEIAVAFQNEGPFITARTLGPSVQEGPVDSPYGHLATPLRQRGLVCSVEFGLSDYIVHAELPDGSAVIISPPQEPATDHRPGYPDEWLVTRVPPEGGTVYEVVYDSQYEGPHARHGGSVPALLAAIDERLDQLGVPTRADFQRSARSDTVEGILHRAGFIPVVRSGDSFHRLPVGMTDPAEQRRAVSRAIDMLKIEGFAFGCPADLIDPGLPLHTDYEVRLGDRISELTASIRSAGHTGEVAAAMSELTVPGNGVLERVVETLNATADWWADLGDPADPHYANRLRYITAKLESYTAEMRAMRNDLADRHTAHPVRPHQHGSPVHGPTSPRVIAAQATSPATRRTTSTGQPVEPTVPPARSSLRPPSPGR